MAPGYGDDASQDRILIGAAGPYLSIMKRKTSDSRVKKETIRNVERSRGRVKSMRSEIGPPDPTFCSSIRNETQFRPKKIESNRILDIIEIQQHGRTNRNKEARPGPIKNTNQMENTVKIDSISFNRVTFQ